MLITWHIFPVFLIFLNSDRTPLCFHRPTRPKETTLGVLFFNTFGEQTLGKQDLEDRYNAGKSQSKRYLVPCAANAILLQNAFWNETINVLCYESKIYFISFELHVVVFFPMFTSFGGVACLGINFAHELLCTTRVKTRKGFTSKQMNINHFTDPG